MSNDDLTHDSNAHSDLEGNQPLENHHQSVKPEATSNPSANYSWNSFNASYLTTTAVARASSSGDISSAVSVVCNVSTASTASSSRRKLPTHIRLTGGPQDFKTRLRASMMLAKAEEEALENRRKRTLAEYTEDYDGALPSISDDEGDEDGDGVIVGAGRSKRRRVDRQSEAYSSYSFISSTSISSRTADISMSISQGPSAMDDPITRRGIELMRSASTMNLRSQTSKYSQESAFYKMNDWGFSIPFSLPPSINPDDFLPLAVSERNNMYFTRGNRVHIKPFSRQSNTNQDVSQIYKLKDSEKYGDVKLIACSGLKEEIVLATTKGSNDAPGTIQILDVESQSKTALWSWRSSKSIGAIEWHGNLVTVGAADDGSVRFYDVRTRAEGGKFLGGLIKSEKRKLTRHEAGITKLGWNRTGRMLASADGNGTVYCWDDRTKKPLDVGESHSRRKRMKHGEAVSALTWHPSKPSILGTADVDGVVRLWDVNTQASENTLGSPGYFEMDSRIVSLHFSSDVKDEFITVHGRKTDTVQDRPGLSQKNTTNTLVAFAFPKFDQIARKGISEAEGRQFSTMMDLGVNGIPTVSWPGSGGIETRETAFRGNRGDVVGSVMINSGTKVVLAVPGEGLLKIWDIWGKADPKQVKKQLSHRDQDFPFRI